MGLLVDPIPNSLNYHYKNCMADSKENYQWDHGSERVQTECYKNGEGGEEMGAGLNKI